MFGRSRQQQAVIQRLQARTQELEALVDQLAARAGVGEAELVRLRAEAGSASLPEECRRLLDQGQVIAAIKAYREHTGAGLAEAKDVIDRHRARGA